MKVKIWLGVGISAVFVWLAFREVDFASLWSALKGADYRYLIPALVITVFQFFLRTVR